MKNIKSLPLLLTSAIIISCSSNVNSLNTSEKIKDNPANISSKQNTFLSKTELAELEKEYSQFKTKSFSEAYLNKKLKKWKDLGTAGDIQLAREIEFARIKHPSLYCTVMDDSSNNLMTYITGVSATPSSEVYTRKSNQPSFATFLASGCTPPAGTILVKYNSPGPTHDGSSWSKAYTSLQTALTAATSGQDIWVAKGIYKPGTQNTDTFQLKNGVGIYGGFSGTEINLGQRTGSNETFLSGDINDNDIADDFINNKSDNSYHVVTGVSGATIDGFTIKSGYAHGSWPTYSYGGGIFNYNGGTQTVSNLTFTNNSASYGGGGMYNYGSSNPTITNVTFDHNATNGNGGGIYNNGSSPTLSNVIFDHNTSTSYGGGMFNDNSSATINKSTFTFNSANTAGGMINQGGSPTITNTIFDHNTAVYAGGMYNGSSSPTITNVTFTFNEANAGWWSYGGGMANSGGSITLINTIFWGNTTLGNNNSHNLNNNATINMGYSVVQGGFTGIIGTGTIKDMTGTTTLDATNFGTVGHNISGDPLFVSSSDFILQSGSPARNTGTNTGAPVTDIVGTSRPRGASTDMGAYEYVE